MADPSPFIQSEWMHGAAPMVLAGMVIASAAYAIGALMGRRAAYMEHEEAKQLRHHHPHIRPIANDTQGEPARTDVFSAILGRPYWHRDTPDAD